MTDEEKLKKESEDWATKYRREAALTAKLNDERMRHNREPVLKALREMEIAVVEVSYSGSGDSGAVDDIRAKRKNEKGDFVDYDGNNHREIEVLVRESKWDEQNHTWDHKNVLKKKPLFEVLADLADQWSDVHHPGWENNDGASGTMTIDVETGEFTLEHTTYYTESETDTYTL